MRKLHLTITHTKYTQWPGPLTKQNLSLFKRVTRLLLINLIDVVFMRLTENRIEPLVAALTGSII
jgi:hypothetical protein